MSDFKIKVNVELNSDDIESKLKGLEGKNYKIPIDLDLKNFDELSSKLKSLKTSFQNAFKLDSSFLSDLKKITNEIDKFNGGGNSPSSPSRQVTSLISEYKDLANTVEKLQKQLSKGGLSDDSVLRTTSQIDQLTAKMNSLRSEIGESKSLELFDFKQANKSIVEFNNYMNKIESQAESLKSKIGDIDFDNISSSSKNALNDILQQIEKIQTEAKDITMNIEVGEALTQLNDMNDTVKKIQNEAKQVSTSAKSSGGLFSSILGTKDDFWGNFSQFTLAEVAGDFISDSIRALASGLKDTIVETDSAIVDLMKVAPDNFSGTGKQLEQYLNQVTEVAKGTGKTSVDTIQATAKALQSGFDDVDKALEYARGASVFSNVGDLEQSEVDTMLASILSAYGGVENALTPVRKQIQGMGEDYNTLTDFVDQANYVGNHFAVTTADVGEALMLSASALQTNGVSMEESIGMITAMTEITQDASKSGNALKSMSANLAGVAVSAKDGTLQTNKTAKALKEIAGIDVWNQQTGEVKDMFTVLDELNGKWDTLSEAEQNALGTTIAGKTQLNNFNALMSNWKTARQYVDEYKQGLTVGSAEQENLRYLDSIQGKWNTIKENLKSIGNSVISSDMVKGVLDIGIALTNLANTGIGKAIAGITASFAGLFTVISGFKAVNKMLDFAGTFSTMTNGFKNVASIAKTSIATIAGFAVTHPVLTAVAGAVIAIGGAWLYYKNAQERAIEKSKENITNLENEIKTESSKQSSLKAIAEEYDNLYWKTNKTSEEMERYKELVNQIAEIAPELVTGYDASGDPILDLNGNAEAYCSTLDRAIEKKRELLNKEENNLADSYKKDISDFMDEYEDFKQQQKNMAENPQPFSYETDEEMYEKALKYYQDYQEKRIAINEQALNQLQDQNFYKNLADSEKSEMDEMYRDIFDVANLYAKQGQSGVSAFINDTDKLKKAFIESSKVSEENKEAINELGQAYSEQKMNLSDYTDGLIDIWEAQGAIDYDSFQQLYNGIREYAESTGDIDGANAQIEKLINLVAEATGMDPLVLKDLLGLDELDVAPLTEAEKRLNSFLETYGTASSNLDKGGLADKIESEYKKIEDAQQRLMKMDRSELTIPTLVEMTTGTTGNVEDLVTEMIAKDLPDEVKYDIMLNVLTDIANTGEISDDTISQIAKALDMPEEEVRARFTVKADIQNQQEIDDFLKLNDDLDLETETQIRAVVNNKEEAEELYNLVKNAPEEKRTDIIADFGNAKKEAMELGTTIEGLPASKKLQYDLIFDGADETIGNIEEVIETMDEADGKEARSKLVAEMEDDQIEMFNQAIENVDGKTVSAFLQTDGAIEALSQCETVQEMLDLINNYQATGEINIETEGEEGIQATKTSMESIDGMRAEGIVSVQTEDEALQYMQGQLVELDGKTYMVTVNADTQEKELVEFKGDVEELDGKTVTTEAQLEQTGTTASDVAKDVESIPDIKEVDVQIKSVQAQLDSLKSQSVTVQILADSSNAMAKVNNVKSQIQAMSNMSVNIQILANSSNAMAKVNNVKSALASLKTTNVQILADSSNAMAKINNVKSGLTSIPKTTTVNILADSSNAMSKIANVKSGLAGIPKTTTVKILADSSNAIAKINNVKSALASLSSSKTISLNVIKTTTERTVKESIPSSVSVISTPQALSTTSLSDIPVSASDSITAPSIDLSNVGVSAKAVNTSTILDSVKYGVDTYTELEQALERISSQLDLIDKKAENAFGQEKINYLNQQVSLLKQQQSIQTQIKQEEQAQLNTLKSWLTSKGFSIDSYGDILNYEEKLLVLEKNVESLKKQSSDNSDNESLKKQYESANEELELTKKYLQEYLNSQKELADATQEWQEYANAIQEAQDEIKELQREMKLDKLENSVAEVNYQLDNLSNKLDKIDEQLDNVGNTDKINLLSQQVDLYNQQLALTTTQLQKIVNLQNGMKFELSAYGFTFDADGLIKNYDEILNQLIGTANYENAKDLAEDYMDLVTGDLADVQKSTIEVQNAIKEAQNEIEELQMQQNLFASTNRIALLDNEYEKLSNTLDILDNKIDSAYGDEKIKLLTESIGTLNKQLDLQNKKIDATKSQLLTYQNALSKYGFNFDSNGNLTNFESVMSVYKNSADLEKINDLVEEFFDLQKDLGGLIVDYDDLEKEILDLKEDISDVNEEMKDALRDQLEATQEIEEKITDIYEKEYERRKKEIEDYTDERIALLNKELDAYKEMREEQDYEKGLQEQTDEVEELRKKLEVAKRDTSIAGLKRQKELAEELAEAEKSLAEYTQDKIDSDFEKNIENEIDRLESERDSLLEALEEQFSEANIARMVAQAISSGFIGINGEIKTLQEALLDSINDTADAYSVMGATIKKELVDNLGIALETMRELDSIYKELNVSDFANVSTNTSPLNTSSYSSNNKTVTVGDTIINIQGSVSDDIISQIEDLIDSKNEQMLKEIVKDL